MAGWWLGANMKPMPVSSTHCAICVGDRLMLRPNDFQHIGAAALAADASAPVLADLGPGRGGHEHGTGRDIEGVRAVAASAHNVHQMGLVGDLDLGRKLAHDLGRGRDLANGFLLDAQPVISAAIITGDISPAMICRIRCSISSWKISRCSMVRCRPPAG
jgi:hypothetical protein